MSDQETERYSLTRAQLLDMAHEFFHQGQDNEPYTVWEMGSVLNQWLEANVTPQPAPADAVTEAAVRAAREWYGRVTALQPLPIQPGTLEHVIILKGRDAAEWHFAAQVRSFRVQFEIEAHRLLDAGESEVRE